MALELSADDASLQPILRCMHRWFDSLEYDWAGLSQQPNLMAKAKRSAWQFLPHHFDNFEWRFFSSPLRCLQSLAPIVFILVAEVSHGHLLCCHIVLPHGCRPQFC